MVDISQIGRKIARKRAHKAVEESLLNTDRPRTGAEVVQQLKQIGVIGAWAHRDDIGDKGDTPGALAALMQQWQQEDAQMSDEEAEQADKDTQEFKAAMNANRQTNGERLVYP